MGDKTEARLRKEYILSLINKQSRISQLWFETREQNQSLLYNKELFFLVHNLYVSAAMHGLGQLSQQAKRLETELLNERWDIHRICESFGELSKAIWLAQEELVQEVQRK